MPLFINLGYLTTVEGEHQNKYALLHNSEFFEDLGILSGFEPTNRQPSFYRSLQKLAKPDSKRLIGQLTIR